MTDSQLIKAFEQLAKGNGLKIASLNVVPLPENTTGTGFYYEDHRDETFEELTRRTGKEFAEAEKSYREADEATKTPLQLITHLDAAEKDWGNAQLIVGFPTRTSVIRGDSPNRLQMLETFLQQGGIPAGVVTTVPRPDSRPRFFYHVFKNDITAGWGEQYMDGVLERMTNAEGDKEDTTDSIGIDQFRILNESQCTE